MGVVALLQNEGGRGTTTTMMVTENKTECLMDLVHGVAYLRAVVYEPNAIFVDFSMVRPSLFLCLFKVMSLCVSVVFEVQNLVS